jgi:hypothetical protein
MKKVLIGTVVVFVIIEVLDFIIHGIVLAPAYAATQNIWRPDMMDKMWIMYIATLVVSYFFTLIFSKGYEGKGAVEGVRFGLYIGVMLGVGMAFGTYAMIAIPFSLALQWFLYSIIEYIIAGIGVALFFGKKK